MPAKTILSVSRDYNVGQNYKFGQNYLRPEDPEIFIIPVGTINSGLNYRRNFNIHTIFLSRSLSSAIKVLYIFFSFLFFTFYSFTNINSFLYGFVLSTLWITFPFIFILLHPFSVYSFYYFHLSSLLSFHSYLSSTFSFFISSFFFLLPYILSFSSFNVHPLLIHLLFFFTLLCLLSSFLFHFIIFYLLSFLFSIFNFHFLFLLMYFSFSLLYNDKIYGYYTHFLRKKENFVMTDKNKLINK
jgi:hypothetical protein